MAKSIAEAATPEARVVTDGAWPFPRKSRKPQAFADVTVTPEMAAEVLAEEAPNRPKSEGTIQAYMRRMEVEGWKLNGEALKFSTDGKLLDGQHRLEACVRSGKPFRTAVVTGVEPEAQATMDDNRRRTVHDQVLLQGMNLPKSASAAARWLLLIRLGTIGRAQRSTNAEVLEVLMKHRDLEQSVAALKDKDVVALPSIVLTMHYIGSKLLSLPEKADSFLSVMSTGVPAYPGDPVHAWREQLSKAARQGHTISAKVQWLGTVHAWNLFVVNAAPKRFQVPEEVQIENLDVRKI